MIGVPKRFPLIPGLVMLKVPPESSSGEIFPDFARAPKSSIAAEISFKDIRSALRSTGTRRPFSVSTATAMWISFFSTVLSPDTIAFMVGVSRSVFAAA